jgi:hypothetical protein
MLKCSFNSQKTDSRESCKASRIPPADPLGYYRDVFGYNFGMEKFREVENKFVSSLDELRIDTKKNAVFTFKNLWMGEKEYAKHYAKRLNKEGSIIDEFDYLSKTFTALNSDEVFFESYDSVDLWDRVFYSKDDNWAVVVAQNGKILTSYRINSTIKDTLSKHENMLNAKISKIGVSDEFQNKIRTITEKLRKL